jgi:magnesium transporter
MARRKRHARKPAGSSPGSIIYIGGGKAHPLTISCTRYGADRCEETKPASVNESDFKLAGDNQGVTWIDVDGVHDTAVLEQFGSAFGLHPLVLEDIVNTSQRPKLEDFGTYIFVALKMITYDRNLRAVSSEHVSLILGEGYVLSFQENPGDVFGPVRERIRTGKGRMRRSGADYLFYALIDAVVDYYFEVLEQLGDDIEELEQEVVEQATPATLRGVHHLKREMILLRRSVWPVREAVNALVRDESDLVTEGTRIFLRDLYDHTIQVIDTVETFRDILSGLLDVYLSSLSNRMNEIMKVLTIISSIFIPLTFIVGVYGMNFKYMPELEWSWGYPSVWILMILSALGLLRLFQKKGWI